MASISFCVGWLDIFIVLAEGLLVEIFLSSTLDEFLESTFFYVFDTNLLDDLDST